MRRIYTIAASIAMLTGLIFTSCTEDSPVTSPTIDNTPITVDRTGFAKGADVSWLTKMESEDQRFYTPDRKPMECMQLLRDVSGINSIRLRVWVNPAKGWNNVDDVLIKARRAHALGMRLMIDFHFSDTWADPGHQTIPAAWADMDLEGVQEAMTVHINDMLNKLKTYDISPEWVQVGNETRTGMMWPLGTLDNGDNFAKLVDTGYDAVKSIFPEAHVIIHCDGGDNSWLYTRLYGYLQEHNAKYDMIGMSLYPDPSNWETTVTACIENINTVATTYNKPVVICEVGMAYNEVEASEAMMTKLMKDSQNTGHVKGLFYWEPQAPAGYNGGYNKGCFINGTPTAALNCFKN